MPLEVIESADIQCAQLLNHHPRSLTGDVNLGPKARRSHALRSRCNEHGRKSEKLVCLDEHGVARPMLLVATTPR
jgi:hypothetical protein